MFRKREALRHVFEATVETCIVEGLAGGRTLSADARMIGAEANSHLIEALPAVNLDIWAGRAIRQAEAGTTRMMIERAPPRFGPTLANLVAGAASAPAENLGLLLNDRGITSRSLRHGMRKGGLGPDLRRVSDMDRLQSLKWPFRRQGCERARRDQGAANPLYPPRQGRRSSAKTDPMSQMTDPAVVDTQCPSFSPLHARGSGRQDRASAPSGRRRQQARCRAQEGLSRARPRS